MIIECQVLIGKNFKFKFKTTFKFEVFAAEQICKATLLDWIAEDQQVPFPSLKLLCINKSWLWKGFQYLSMRYCLSANDMSWCVSIFNNVLTMSFTFNHPKISNRLCCIVRVDLWVSWIYYREFSLFSSTVKKSVECSNGFMAPSRSSHSYGPATVSDKQPQLILNHELSVFKEILKNRSHMV